MIIRQYRLLLLMFLLALTACSTHSQEQPFIIKHISQPMRPVADQEAFSDDNRYIYEPPHVYRTWINSRATDNNQVMSAHFRYWVASQGHWNVPLETKTGSGSDILEPAG